MGVRHFQEECPEFNCTGPIEVRYLLPMRPSVYESACQIINKLKQKGADFSVELGIFSITVARVMS